MATLLGYNPLSLTELMRRKDPNGDMATIVETLNRTNEIIQDIPWIESNDAFSNKTIQRLNLPTGSYRGLNEGVSAEASSTRELWDVIGFLESYSEPDVKWVRAQPDPTGARWQESIAFLEGMAQTFAANLIYGNTVTNPRTFTGLAPRMAALNSLNVFGNSGSGSDVSSIYVVQWGPDKVHGIYPRGSKAGLVHEDLGEQTQIDANGKKWQIFRDHFTWDHGLVVRNPKCIGRMANIETSGTTNIFDAANTTYKLLIQILNRMPMRGRGACIYVNPTIMSQIDVAAASKSNVFYTAPDYFGQPVMTFRGTNPIRMVEAILDTETNIS